jgi:hypothetical protein
MRVRSVTSANSHARGREAERMAIQFFQNRGHAVVDVSNQNAMHDLEVHGFGRVQVKRAFLVKKHRSNAGGKSHRDASPANWRYRAKLSQGNTGARYPANAWEWLCIVIVLASGPRFILRRASECVVAGKEYMSDVVSIAKSRAALCWQTLDPVETFWGKEAKDGEATSE